jgi:hypothetical protein
VKLDGRQVASGKDRRIGQGFSKVSLTILGVWADKTERSHRVCKKTPNRVWHITTFSASQQTKRKIAQRG